MTPEFSVIVPIYNVEKYLRACLDSILGQSFAGFELILADDGSPDGCGAICDEYARRDGRVQVIHLPNRGVTAARRAALDRARAEYICFVDGDDRVTENWLQTVHDCMTRYGWPDMLLFGRVRVWEDRSRPDREYPPKLAPGLYDKARLEREVYPYMLCDSRIRHTSLHEMIPGYLWEKVFRRQLLLEHFLQDETIPIFEDVLMLYECLYNARSLAVCPELLYIYLQRGDSAVHRRDPQLIFHMEKGLCYLDEHLLRQAPQLRSQVDMFFIIQLVWALEKEFDSGFGLRQTADHVSGPLRQTGLIRHLTAVPRQPFYWLFMLLMRMGLLYPALLLVLVNHKIHRK